MASITGEWKLWDGSFRTVVATVDNHFGENWRRVSGKTEGAKTMTSARFVLKVYREIKAQSTEVQSKQLTLLVIHAGACGAKTAVYLIHCWNHIRPVEHSSTGEENLIGFLLSKMVIELGFLLN